MGFGFFKGLFTRNDYEDRYAEFEGGMRESSRRDFETRTAQEQRFLEQTKDSDPASPEYGRFISRSDYARRRTIRDRKTIASAGDFDLRIQPFVPGAVPGIGVPDTPVPAFNRPMGFIQRDTKATLVIQDAAGGRSYTQEFVLSEVQEEHNERYQLLDTFAGWDMILYGSDPVFVSAAGYLPDGVHYSSNWANRFRDLYEEKLRGPVAVREGRRVFLIYSGRQVEGVILKLRLHQTSNPGHLVDFSWMMVVLSNVEINAPEEPASSAAEAIGPVGSGGSGSAGSLGGHSFVERMIA